MTKKILCAALALCLLLLPGCNLLGQNTNDLLRAPALGQGQGEVQRALAQSIGEEPQYVFPKEGTQRSPLLMTDLDGDGAEEAVLLYTYPSSSALAKNKGSNVYFSIMKKQDDGRWQLQQEFRGLSTDVASIEAAQLLPANPTQQLVIGFSASNLTNKVLGLFESIDGKYTLMYQTPYTRYEIANFTGTGNAELMLVTPYDQVTGIKLVFLPTYGGVFVTPQTITLDQNFVSCAGIHPSRAAPGSTEGNSNAPGRVVVVDGVLSTGILGSQFVYYGGEGFYTVDDAGTLLSQTARSSPLLVSRDINGDGFVEIPQEVQNTGMPNESAGVSFVEWTDHINVLPGEDPQVREWGLLDSDRGVYIRLPSDWYGKISVIEGSSGTSWQVLRTATQALLLDIQDLPAGAAIPSGALEVPATVNTYLVVQPAVGENERTQVRVISLVI